MQTVEVSEVVVLGDRDRKVFEQTALAELADSIREKGLFHPILLQNDKKTLVAGERRLRATRLLYENGATFSHDGEAVGMGQVPFVTLGELTGFQVREAQLDENLKRVDLSWQEKAFAVRDLHKLRADQAAEKGRTQRKTDTAKEIYGDAYHTKKINEVSKDLTAAQFLDDPEVVKAKNRTEALKIIEKKLKKKHRAALAETYDLSRMDSPHVLILGDLRDKLPEMKADQFDCIIADPPYGIAANTFKNQSAVKHDYDDDQSYADEIMTCVATEGFRITKIEAHIYVFCDILRFPQIKKEIFEPAGWYVWKWPLIWFRGVTNGLLPRPHHGPRRCYEAVLYGIKGDKKTHTVGPDVLAFPHDRDTERGAHKPPDLFEALINRSCLPGNTVLDPCCGTGPVLEAAERANVLVTAVERDKAAFSQAVERLGRDE